MRFKAVRASQFIREGGTGSFPSGYVFEGSIFSDFDHKQHVATGVFIIANDNGIHTAVDLETGTHYRKDHFISVIRDKGIQLLPIDAGNA